MWILAILYKWWKLLTAFKSVKGEEKKQPANSPSSPLPYALKIAGNKIDATPNSPLNKKVLFAVTPTPSVGKDAPLKKRKREHNETEKPEEGDVATGSEYEEENSEIEVSSLELTQRQPGLGPCYFVATQSDGTQSDGTQLGTQPEGQENVGPKEISKEVLILEYEIFIYMYEYFFYNGMILHVFHTI